MLPRFAIRKGDAGGANPGPDANWDAYLLLARVSIPGSAPNIAACTITDARVFTYPLGTTPHDLDWDAHWLPIGLLASDSSPGSPGSATWSTIDTVGWSMPAGWSTAFVMLHGVFQSEFSGGRTFDLRFLLPDGTNSPAIRKSADVGSQNHEITWFDTLTATGTGLITLQGNDTDGGTNPGALQAYIQTFTARIA